MLHWLKAVALLPVPAWFACSAQVLQYYLGRRSCEQDLERELWRTLNNGGTGQRGSQ